MNPGHLYLFPEVGPEEAAALIATQLIDRVDAHPDRLVVAFLRGITLRITAEAGRLRYAVADVEGFPPEPEGAA